MQPLISTDDLNARLGQKNLRVYDCSVALTPKPEGGFVSSDCRAQWREAHIPGAGYLSLIDEFSDTSSALPFMMPPAGNLAASFGRAGIDSDSEVVLYNRGPGWWAMRVWWMLRSLGFDAAAVLDGGWDKWRAEGRSVTSGDEGYAPGEFPEGTQREVFLDWRRVLDAVDDADSVLINALPAASFRGETQTYARPGRIRGSVSVPAPALFRDDQTLVSEDELASAFTQVGALSAPQAINYCGGGISAATDAFVLHLLGHTNVQIYDGSMTEWASRSDLPMETG